MASINRFGQLQPLVFDRSGNSLDSFSAKLMQGALLIMSQKYRRPETSKEAPRRKGIPTNPIVPTKEPAEGSRETVDQELTKERDSGATKNFKRAYGTLR